MIENEFAIEINGNRIAGTVCLPDSDKPYPIVLFIHGSGPVDRNENIKGFKINAFNTIAHYLADYEIGSLRYDKRGCGKSKGNYNSTGHADLVADAQGLVEYLMQSDFCDRDQIYLLGHSEGTIIAPQVSNANSLIAGLILLCPFVQPLHDVLKQQANHVSQDIQNISGIKGKLLRLVIGFLGDPINIQEKLIERIRQSTTPTIKYKLKTINALWFREILVIDAESIFQQVACPMLVIGGEKDIQCDPDDVESIKNIAPSEVETHIIQNMTHLLRCDEEEPSIFNYKKLIKQDFEHQVLELSQQWLMKHIDGSSIES